MCNFSLPWFNEGHCLQGRSLPAANFALDGVGEPPEVVVRVDGREGQAGAEAAAPREVARGQDQRVCLPH